MGRPVVQVDHLTKSFNGFVAVNDLSFSIEEGEILGLLGPNGAGKTTLIQMLLGLITPTSGEIRILGLDLKRHREAILSQVNFSSTYVSMPTSLTLRENLTVFAKLYGLRHPETRIDELLDLFEIQRLKNTITRHLSSGQMTRLSLVKSLLNRPKVLFLDEPTASLDPDIADKTRRLLRSIRDQSRLTLLYTSHNMKEMEEISDRIVFLHQGRILASGTPAEILRIFAERNLEDVFLKVARGNHLMEDGEMRP
ncbi:MAG: ABC transporter ATP-binding protein [Nitrospirae bacterium]|nr:ABC transporter ATP-binding protein [Candidatus Manganitrophaceae bacterium]